MYSMFQLAVGSAVVLHVSMDGTVEVIAVRLCTVMSAVLLTQKHTDAH